MSHTRILLPQKSIFVDYGLLPTDDHDHDIVCTVTNYIVNIDLSLWTPLFSEDVRRHACVQYKTRSCSCGSTEHSLRWRPVSFKNIFSLFNPNFGTHDSDGSEIETWKLCMRHWRQRAFPRGRQGYNRRNGPGNGRSHYSNDRGYIPTYQGNHTGITRAYVPTGVQTFPGRPTPSISQYLPQRPPLL